MTPTDEQLLNFGRWISDSDIDCNRCNECVLDNAVDYSTEHENDCNDSHTCYRSFAKQLLNLWINKQKEANK